MKTHAPGLHEKGAAQGSETPRGVSHGPAAQCVVVVIEGADAAHALLPQPLQVFQVVLDFDEIDAFRVDQLSPHAFQVRPGENDAQALRRANLLQIAPDQLELRLLRRASQPFQGREHTAELRRRGDVDLIRQIGALIGQIHHPAQIGMKIPNVFQFNRHPHSLPESGPGNFPGVKHHHTMQESGFAFALSPKLA